MGKTFRRNSKNNSKSNGKYDKRRDKWEDKRNWNPKDLRSEDYDDYRR